MNRDEIISVLHEFKERYAEKYGILSLCVFGSVARGEMHESSDVDICVTTKTPDPFLLVHFKGEIEGRLSRRVDIVRLREKMNPFLRKRIEQEGIRI